MLKKLMKAVVVTATVMALGSTGAFADDGKAKIKEYVYDVESDEAAFLHVTSSDGTKWDNLKSGILPFSAHMKIDSKWPGAVESVAVVLGNCSGASCKSFPILWSGSVGKRDFDHHGVFSVHTSVIENATPGVALVGQNIIDTCNQHLTSDGATKKHEFQSSLPTTFIADTVKRDLGAVDPPQAQMTPPYVYPHNIDHAKSGDFTFKVVCDQYIPNTTVGDLKVEEADFKVTGIDLILTTFPNDTHQPTPGLNCPVVHVTTQVTTNLAGLAGADRLAQIGEGVPETANLLIGTSFNPEDGSYSGKQTEKYYLGPNTHARFYASIQSGGVAMSTPWKGITVQCKGPGSGLTTHKDEPMAPPRTLKGDFSFVDHGAPKCAREGKALISFSSNQPGDVHYTLDCTNGQNFSGTAALVKNPAGGYVAAALKSFDVATSTVYSCALKSSAPGAAKLHQWKGHTFKCVHRAVETGPNDVQVDPKPTDDAPRTPAADVKVAPKPMDVDADKKRQEALEKAREATRKKAEAEKKAAEEALRKKAEAAKKAAQKAAEEALRKKAEAAKKAAQKAAEEALRKKAEAAKKAAQKAAAEAQRKRAEAAKKAEEVRRKRAEAAKKAAEEARRKREAAKQGRKPRSNAVMQSLGRR